MKKHQVILTVILILGIGLFSACKEIPKKSETPKKTIETKQPVEAVPLKKEKDIIKAAWIYVGPVGDAGWTFAHDEGRRAAEKALPYLKTAYIESVAEGSNAERIIRKYARAGYDIIFTTSFGFMNPTIKVAAEFPKVKFMHCAGYKKAENAGTYFGRMEEGAYLSGLIAGKLTKTFIIGYVAPFPIPEVIRFVNAFTIGVRLANPKAKVQVIWINSWYDPAKEKDAARSLFEIKADIVATGADSAAPLIEAQEKGKLAIGYDSDTSKYAPKSFVVAPVWKWGGMYIDIIKRVKDGTWKSEDMMWGMDKGLIELTPFGKMVPQEVADLVEAKKKEILDGKFKVFQGPLKDQTGKVVIKAGEVMSEKDILGIKFFVEGIVGKLPEK